MEVEAEEPQGGLAWLPAVAELEILQAVEGARGWPGIATTAPGESGGGSGMGAEVVGGVGARAGYGAVGVARCGGVMGRLQGGARGARWDAGGGSKGETGEVGSKRQWLSG